MGLLATTGLEIDVARLPMELGLMSTSKLLSSLELDGSIPLPSVNMGRLVLVGTGDEVLGTVGPVVVAIMDSVLLKDDDAAEGNVAETKMAGVVAAASILVTTSNVGDWLSSDMVGVGAISTLAVSVSNEPAASVLSRLVVSWI